MKDNFKFTDYLKNNPLLNENTDMEEGKGKNMIAILQQNRAEKYIPILQKAGVAISIVRTILNQQSGASPEEVEKFIQRQLNKNTYGEE